MKSYKVTTNLRLRSAAEIDPGNILTVLPEDTVVKEEDDATNVGWLHVNTTISGHLLKGFVSSSFVEEILQDILPEVSANISEVNLSTSKHISLSDTSGRSYPLNQTGMPVRVVADATQLWKIIDFLNVEQSIRYQPANGQTFCNIYAYDYCHLAKSYIPRVWWSGRALTRLAKGETVPIVYGDTVNELNANSLYDWFNDFGDDFGWTRIFDLDVFQSEVNKGKVGIIVAKRNDLSRSGHILAVIPETTDKKAISTSGKVTSLLQSQAGATNKKAFTSQWYLSANFRGFSFWLHD